MAAAGAGATAFIYPAAYQSPASAAPLTDGATGRYAPAAGWDAIIDKLLTFRTLEDDWDGDGTAAPGPALVDHAIITALSLRQSGYPPADWVVVDVNATIQFEWRFPPRGAYGVEVLSPDRVEHWRVDDWNAPAGRA